MSKVWTNVTKTINRASQRRVRKVTLIPNFEDHRLAYSNKNTIELVRALLVLKVCSIDYFARNGEKIYWLCHKLLGGRLVNFASKPFYSQFVGGNNESEMEKSVRKLAKADVRLMVLPQYEEDVGDPDTKEAKYNKNFSRLLELSDLVPRLGGASSLMQFKTSGVMPADLLVKLSEECANTQSRIKLVENTAEAIVNNKELDCLTKLNKQNRKLLSDSLRRIHTIVKTCNEKKQRILFDAEYTYMNPGISLLALALMAVYNRDTPFIWNTYQCYLKTAYQNAKEDLELSKALAVSFGAKIVRGAYMAQERERAQRKSISDPVNDTYEDTGKVYDKVISFFLNHIKEVRNKCNIVIATHNEASIRNAINKIIADRIDLSEGAVQFAQIYGMSDQLCVPLAAAGLPVYKSVPFGSTEESLPYLARRAQENKAVLAGARRDIDFMKKELKTRMALNESYL